MLLQGHLQRLGRARRRNDKSPARRQLGAVERTRALASGAELSDAEIGRALVSGLLEEEFGPDLVNDAQFQSLIDDVGAAIASSSEARALLQRAIHQLRAP